MKTPKFEEPTKPGGNRGGGSPIGHCQPIPAPQDVIVESVIELAAGVSPGQVAEKYHLPASDVRRIQTLVGLTPQQYFDKISDKMEGVLELTLANLREKVENGEGSVSANAIAIGILAGHLRELRGQAKPTTLNQTNIQINNLSREDAKKFLLGENK